MSKKVVVIGAGLAGLNCARTLHKAGAEVVVLESSNRIGGRVGTDYVDGFTLDHGFQVINPAYSELIRTGVVEQLKLMPLPKGIEVYDSGRLLLLGDPRAGWQYLAGAISGSSGTVGEKLNFLRFMAGGDKEGNLGVAMEKSGSFYQKIMKPFLSGVFLTNPDEISAAVAGEFLTWFRKGSPGVPKNGAQSLPNALAANLNIQLKNLVTGIQDRSVKSANGDYLADVVVLATGQKQAAQLLGRGKWSSNSSITWYHSVPRGLIESKHLRTYPNSAITNSVAISNIATSYAPVEQTLISTTALQDVTETELLRDLAQLWSISPKEFSFIKRYELPESLPKHLPGKPLLSPLRVTDSLYVIGDHQAVPSQQGALLTGRLAAEEILKN